MQNSAEQTSVTFEQARHGLHKAMAMVFFYNVDGVLMILGYMTLVYSDPFAGADPWPILLFVGAAFPFSWALAYWYMRPTIAYFKRDNAPGAKPVPEDVARNVLNMPFLLARNICINWLLFGSAAFLAYSTSPYPLKDIALHLMTSTVFGAEVVALLAMYHSERILFLRGTLEFVLDGRPVSSIKGVMAFPVWGRILLFVLTAVVIPMIYLFVTRVMGNQPYLAVVFTFALSLALAVYQGMFIVGSIAGPIGRISARFREFAEDPGRARPARVYRADALGQLGEMYDTFVSTWRERDFIRRTFGQYVSRQVVEHILDGRVELGGHHAHATVLFSDIRGFTTLTESMAPEQVVEFLNEYFEKMVAVLTRHMGTPDKFIGDGLLAVWGVPVAQADTDRLAVEAALEMLAAVEVLSERWQQKGLDKLAIGIGVHCGELIAGNIGSSEKMEYTIVGDTVNTCSRIEGLCKTTGSPLVISEAVWAAIPPALQQRFGSPQPADIRGRNQQVIVRALQS